MEHTRIRADRPRSPTFARYLTSRSMGLRRDLEDYLRTYNMDRAHSGRHTKGRTPDRVLGKGKLWW